MHPLNMQSLFFQAYLRESSLSEYLHMAVTMKSAKKVLELADFPDEIILKVFACLKLSDLLKCGQVAKRFRNIAHDQFLWQRIVMINQHFSTAFIRFILDRGCKYLDLSYSRFIDLETSTQHIFNNVAELKELNLERVNISEEESLFLVQNLTSKLKKLNLGVLHYKDPDEHIKIIVERCNHLQELQLQYCFPITDIAITSILEGLKNTLENLDLYSCEKISYPKLLELPVMSKLKNVYIWKNKEVRRLRIEFLKHKVERTEGASAHFPKWKFIFWP